MISFSENSYCLGKNVFFSFLGLLKRIQLQKLNTQIHLYIKCVISENESYICYKLNLKLIKYQIHLPAARTCLSYSHLCLFTHLADVFIQS